MFVHQGKKEILYSSHRQYGKTRSHFIYFFPRAPHLMFHRSVSPFPLFSDVFSFKMTLNVTSVLPMLMTSVHCQLVDVPGTQSRSPVVSALGRSAPVTASRTSVRMRKKTLFTSPLLPPPLRYTRTHKCIGVFGLASASTDPKMFSTNDDCVMYGKVRSRFLFNTNFQLT